MDPTKRATLSRFLNEIVWQLTQVEQGPIPLELRKVSPELLRWSCVRCPRNSWRHELQAEEIRAVLRPGATEAEIQATGERLLSLAA